MQEGRLTHTNSWHDDNHPARGSNKHLIWVHIHYGVTMSNKSLVPSPCMPPSEKWSGEQSQISWAYYPKHVAKHQWDVLVISITLIKSFSNPAPRLHPSIHHLQGWFVHVLREPGNEVTLLVCMAFGDLVIETKLTRRKLWKCGTKTKQNAESTNLLQVN